VKLLVLWVAAAFLSLTFASSSAPVYGQSSGAGGKASQGSASGKASKTGATSKKQ
jgi:hypothetical protein